jgi:hypothetical protein
MSSSNNSRRLTVLRSIALSCSLFLCATIALLTATPLFAQPTSGGGVTGTITDPHGTVVPHAKVTAVNTETGAQLSSESGSVGVYQLDPLQPGTYNVEVVAKGFSRLLQENVNVVNSAMFGLNMKLIPWDESKTITVTDAPPFLNTLNGASIEHNLYTVQPPSASSTGSFQDLMPGVTVVQNDGGIQGNSTNTNTAAAVPLFRDPIHDGAADPVVVWNRARKTWWMLYTNRRADLAGGGGVTWVHGTHIGIAESADGGAHWKYISEAAIPLPQPDYTLWAPEVIYTGGTYHMFLTVVPGTFTDWNHPRHILHLTSQDLVHWKPLANANLESDRTIDACIFRLPSGLWRLWYKNEADSSKVYFSDSPGLMHWTAKGIATTNHGEGPVVFQWRGSYWLINDPHAGLAVFRSSDLTTWKQQPHNLLSEPGTQSTDRAMGNHADVVVDGSGRAWLFYFTQQGSADAQGHDPGWARRSALHVTELHEANGILTVDRNAPATIHMLPPPINKKSDMAGSW